MITRLKVSGFKNLVDVDVHFGPFTCIAGPNGVGKSNLFDAIRFLSALADKTFVDAARSVRDEGGRTGDIHSLFHRAGDRIANRMRFEAEMIIPAGGTDHLGQSAEAKATFLRYSIELGYAANDSDFAAANLTLIHEELIDIKANEGRQRLKFPHKPEWYKDAIRTSTRKSPFISTLGVGTNAVVKLHQENVQGRTTDRPAIQLPRTVLSATNASESPTALLVKQEMLSWRLLQLEPTALRRPDDFAAVPRMGFDGSHLPATLFRLSKSNTKVYESVASRLQQLIRDVRAIDIDRDEKRELLSLRATDSSGTALPARALSDGTLRFLALAVLDLDPEAVGVICFEEPENGIHPARVPAILGLLDDIAVNTNTPTSPTNPLRQIIVNTHSPLVVAIVAEEDLLCADTTEIRQDDHVFRNVSFQCMEETWRCKLTPQPQSISKGTLLALLQPPAEHEKPLPRSKRKPRRTQVKDSNIVKGLFDHLILESA